MRAERTAPSLKLLGAARFVRFNASRELVKKGKIIVIKAQLQRASWNTLKYLKATTQPSPHSSLRTKTRCLPEHRDNVLGCRTWIR